MLRNLPRVLLHAEGTLVLVLAVALYLQLGGSWILLLVLFLAPDLSMIAYVAGPRTGSVAYNAAHTYAGPLLLAAGGVALAVDVAALVALVWAAHIGMDRMIGYGLKYPTAFKDTHLQRV